MAGYSGTPLVRKLGIGPGMACHVKGAPDDYADLVAPLPEGATLSARLGATTDFVHLFTARRAELQKTLATCRARLRPDSVVWVSWPKKSARLPTEVTEDTIREVALPLGFVDVKVCAVTDVWSGLKLVVRRELR